jgi:hypothetical protein
MDEPGSSSVGVRAGSLNCASPFMRGDDPGTPAVPLIELPESTDVCERTSGLVEPEVGFEPTT